jgi:hypothetical protein
MELVEYKASPAIALPTKINKIMNKNCGIFGSFFGFGCIMRVSIIWVETA